jgi:transcriptional regulator with XRE-family HTH domain
MNDAQIIRAAARTAARLHRGLAEDVDRLPLDAGLAVTELARASGVDPGFLHRILDGRERPSVETYARLAAALGTDLSTRLYPNTGPAVRDRHQAPMLEALLRERHPRWHPFTELAVRRPSRGWIDAALHDPREGVVVASELQSKLRRLEQLVRWSIEKAASLPSWDGWMRLGEHEPRVVRLLVVRRTRATRAVAVEFAGQLGVAYPAHPDDALEALRGPRTGPARRWSGRWSNAAERASCPADEDCQAVTSAIAAMIRSMPNS